MSVLRNWRTRLFSALAVLAVSGGTLIATSSPAAAAEQHCNFNANFNACLTLTDKGYFWYDATVGLDVHMSQQYAQWLVDCPHVVRSTIWGDDGGSNRSRIRDLVLSPGWPDTVADPDGYGVRLFTLDINSEELNEDGDDDRDEFYATIQYLDCMTGFWSPEYRTGEFVGDYRS
jgi:hypothetical protein